MDPKVFKAYDVRGIYPSEINEDVARRVAGAYATYLKLEGKTVAVGRDVRLSGPSLQEAVIKGLTAAGVNVLDIGVGPTELLYFAVGSLDLDGGIQVSASHNPAEYNGLKLIKRGVEAISADTGLQEIKALALGAEAFSPENRGTIQEKQLGAEYVRFVAGLVNTPERPKLRVVANNNFGASGPLAKQVLQLLNWPIELVELNFEPNGVFPKGRPDPLLPENRAETAQLIREHEADLGVAWDADGDRCYIADENGEFIEGCHLTAILANHLLKEHPGEKIIYDPRNVWAVEETVKAAGGVPILNKAGHTFIKNRMKQEGALFAGEMSGHFYYRDFYNADNGILTFLTFLEIVAKANKKVSAIAAPFREKYFVSREINFRVKDAAIVTADVTKQYGDGAIDLTDGLSVNHSGWRFNLRSSNTEPLLRLNVEARDEATCLTKTNLLVELLSQHAAKANDQ